MANTKQIIVRKAQKGLGETKPRESAWRFSGELTANPELLLPTNIDEPRMLKDAGSRISLGTDAVDPVTRTSENIQFAAFAEQLNLQPLSCSFL
jgi:hypothetical protein